MRVHVELSHRVDVSDWRRRHAVGEVPDASPYGLDRLEPLGFELGYRPAIRTRALDSAARAVLRKGAHGLEFGEAFRDSARRRAELVLCWDERTGAPAGLRARLPGEPPAVTGVIWATEPSESEAIRRLVALSLRSSPAVWALSIAQVDVLRRSWRLADDAVHWLPFGVDTTFWRLRPEEDVPRRGQVLAVGNDRHRDHALLVESVRRARQVDEDIRLDLVTNQTVALTSMPGRVHTSKSHVDLRQLYGSSSVVALALRPNLHVSGITVALEAMACARPVVITGTAGMSDYVEDGVSGYLVPPDDPDALSSAVTKLTRDPEMAAAMGRAGFRRASALFSTSAMSARLADFLRHAVR